MPKLTPRPLPVPSQQDDPLRTALADAIAKCNEAKDVALAAHAAARRAQEHVDAAKARLEQTNEAVTAARDRHALVLINAAKDDRAAPSDKTLRAARSEAEIATDDLEAAEHALRTLSAACAEPDALLERTEREVAEAADMILAQRAPEILAEAEALARALSNRLLELNFLRDVLARCAVARRRRIIAGHDTTEAIALLNSQPEDNTAKAINRFLATPLSPDTTSDWRGHPHLDAWQAALAALKADPDGPLP